MKNDRLNAAPSGATIAEQFSDSRVAQVKFAAE